MNLTNSITIVGDKLCSTPEEIRDAAIETLAWHGYSELDSDPLELQVDGPFEDIFDEQEIATPAIAQMISVSTSWGSNARTDLETELVAAFVHRQDAYAFVDRHNEAALQDIISSAEPTELPFPVSFVHFDYCKPGQFPQSRVARIDCEWTDSENRRRSITATGYGDAPLVRETHSAKALAAAVENLLAQLADPTAGLDEEE